MRLKETLEEIKLGENDFITVWYKNPRDKYSSRVTNHQKYYDCDVNSYHEYVTDWIDPVTQLKGSCKQYSVEIDWDEVRIIKERERQKNK